MFFFSLLFPLNNPERSSRSVIHEVVITTCCVITRRVSSTKWSSQRVVSSLEECHPRSGHHNVLCHPRSGHLNTTFVLDFPFEEEM